MIHPQAIGRSCPNATRSSKCVSSSSWSASPSLHRGNTPTHYHLLSNSKNIHTFTQNTLQIPRLLANNDRKWCHDDRNKKTKTNKQKEKAAWRLMVVQCSFLLHSPLPHLLPCESRVKKLRENSYYRPKGCWECSGVASELWLSHLQSHTPAERLDHQHAPSSTVHIQGHLNTFLSLQLFLTAHQLVVIGFCPFQDFVPMLADCIGNVAAVSRLSENSLPSSTRSRY